MVNGIRRKYNALVEDLDERGRRRWAATEAESIGYGGIVAVAQATGMSDRTVRSGIEEIRKGRTVPAGRQRKIGGGRKSLEAEQLNLVQAVENLVEPTERGRRGRGVFEPINRISNPKRAESGMSLEAKRKTNPRRRGTSKPGRRALGDRPDVHSGQRSDVLSGDVLG